ncbi:DUF3263 domain-containing protein [Sphaerisporangium sp. NBC_01403]|uniref:DUF3263 domain-containing protein n=1 Tax=Sphaerisporangium TaxID=321315 RepID=UPI00324F226D
MDTAPEHGDSDPEEPSAPRTPGELTERERELLAFERQWWRHAGAKEQAIRETFGISSTRYYQLLGQLVDRPEAMAHDPMTVKRLRRLRASRQRERAARRLGMRP